MRISSFITRRPAEPLPISLADEAVAMAGFHDAMRSQSISDLGELRRRLAANIEAETKALAAVDEQIARDEAAAMLTDVTPIREENSRPMPSPPGRKGKAREAAE